MSEMFDDLDRGDDPFGDRIAVAPPSRRRLLAGMSASLVGAACPGITRAARPKPVSRYRMLLNSGYSGVNSWFVIAQDKGYLRDEGIEIDFTPGRGAYTAAPRMAAEGFDLGYGDINALIEVVANSAEPAKVPVGVYMMFNQSPSIIGVAADGPIRTPRDLVGKRIAAHPTDVALGTFPAYARATGLAPSAITVVPSDASMTELVTDMLAGKSDGVFGYFTTQTAAALTAGLNPEARLRFLRYDAALPDFYGSAVMASADMVTKHADDVKRILRAFNRGVVDAARDPEAAVAAVMRRDTSLRREVELSRLTETLRHEMNHAERATLGIGDASDARLARAIAAMVQTKSLPRTPATRSIFTRAFLPPRSARLG